MWTHTTCALEFHHVDPGFCKQITAYQMTYQMTHHCNVSIIAIKFVFSRRDFVFLPQCLAAIWWETRAGWSAGWVCGWTGSLAARGKTSPRSHVSGRDPAGPLWPQGSSRGRGHQSQRSPAQAWCPSVARSVLMLYMWHIVTCDSQQSESLWHVTANYVSLYDNSSNCDMWLSTLYLTMVILYCCDIWLSTL